MDPLSRGRARNVLCAKLAPALAMGNAVVLKPAEWTPMTATVLAAICQLAGIPDGVVNVVHGFGPGSAGEAIARHPGIGALAFTGETTTGKRIMEAAAGNLKKVSFELGGKDPNIAFADCNVEEVVDATVRASFLNQGEICLSGSRAYVQRPIFEQFMQRFLAKTGQQVVGDPQSPKTNIGALISKEHYERVQGYIDGARTEGGKILAGGAGRRGWSAGTSSSPPW